MADSSSPSGSAPLLDEDAVADFAGIGRDDFASARALWRRVAPKPLKNLLDAKQIDRE